MSRIRTFSLFLLRELYRSPAGALPPVLALAFYWLLFTLFRVDAEYLVTMGGFAMSTVALLTAFLLATRANRALTYPFLLRLPRRAHLLAAVALASVLSTTGIAVVFAASVIVRYAVPLDGFVLVALATRWLALFGFASAVGLHLSQLVSRHNSHLVAFVVLGAFPTISDNQRHLLRHGLAWLAEAAGVVAWPIQTTMTGRLDLPAATWLLALGLTLLYSAVLGALAAGLFCRKDLLWTE